jgi:hypothetical protein
MAAPDDAPPAAAPRVAFQTESPVWVQLDRLTFFGFADGRLKGSQGSKDNRTKTILLINKSETPSRRELFWGEAIWGRTDGPINQSIAGRTKSLIEALCSHLKNNITNQPCRNKCKPVESGSPLGWPAVGGHLGLAAVSLLHSLS